MERCQSSAFTASDERARSHSRDERAFPRRDVFRAIDETIAPPRAAASARAHRTRRRRTSKSFARILNARCFFVGALGLLFAPAAPCLLLASLGDLLLFQPLWARNLAQAYSAPRADTGGRLWVEAMRYTAYALALSNLALCATLASRGCPYAALSVGFLPLLTLRAERRAA